MIVGDEELSTYIDDASQSGRKVENVMETKGTTVAPIGTPAVTNAPLAMPSTPRPHQDTPVLPVTPLLNYAQPQKTKSPLILPATPIIPLASIGNVVDSKKNKTQNDSANSVEATIFTDAKTLANNSGKPNITPVKPNVNTNITSPAVLRTPVSDKSISIPATPMRESPTTSKGQTVVKAAIPVPTKAPRNLRIISSNVPPTSNEIVPVVDKRNAHSTSTITSTSTATSKSVARPSTPVNEFVSDTGSTASSIRGLGSPMLPDEGSPRGNLIPLAKIKSKSALKKERIAAQKEREKEATIIPIPVPTEEGEHAPVVARARKKERKAAAAAAAFAAANAVKAHQSKASAPEMEPTSSQTSDIKETGSVSSEQNKSTSIPFATTRETPELVDLSINNSQSGENSVTGADLLTHLTAAEIIRDAQESGEIDFHEFEMLRPPTGLSTRHEVTKDEFKEFGKRFEAALSRMKTGSSNFNEHQLSIDLPSFTQSADTAQGNMQKRLIVTPGGIMLRGLTKDQEARFLKLEARSGKSLPSYFHSSISQKFQSQQYTEGLPCDLVDSPEDLSIEETLAYLSRMHKHLEASSSDIVSDAQDAVGNMTRLYETRNNAFNDQDLINSNKIDNSTFSVAKAVDSMLLASLHSEVLEPVTETSMKVEDAERLLGISRKETEMYEKKLNALVKRNRKLVFGAIDVS